VVGNRTVDGDSDCHGLPVLTLKNPANRWANIIVAIVFFTFNLIRLPTYPSAYDKFLIVVGLGSTY
jgi:hypothetical protein